MMNYAALTTVASLKSPSIKYATISDSIMMVSDQRAPMISMK